MYRQVLYLLNAGITFICPYFWLDNDAIVSLCKGLVRGRGGGGVKHGLLTDL